MKALLTATLLLAWPLASTAGEIQPYQAKEIKPYQAQTIQVDKAKESKPERGRTIPKERTTAARAESGKTLPTGQPAGQARLFTKSDFAEMKKNDTKAGRTRAAMSKGNSTNADKGRPRTINNDPYNTGGWNHNSNQPASPIWNPNSQ